MYLTASTIFHYLLERGLADSQSVVEGDFSITELDRHNRGFIVLRQKQPSLYVKQLKVFDDTNVQCLRREAACLRLAHSKDRFGPIARLMPRFVDHDPRRHTVIVRYLPDSENAHQYQERIGRFPVEIGRLLGNALGVLHGKAGNDLATRAEGTTFPRQAPWVLSFHLTSEGHFSGGNLELQDTIQQDAGICQHLDRLSEQWKGEGLIHGDARWNNFVVYQGEQQAIDGRLIDWEMSDVGDPRWDVGTVLQNYWSYWILGTPISASTSVEQLVERAGGALEPMRSALCEFWKSYAAQRQFSGDIEQNRLEECVRYGAARMIQTTYEYMYDEPELSEAARTLVKCSRWILDQPQAAIPLFFG